MNLKVRSVEILKIRRETGYRDFITHLLYWKAKAAILFWTLFILLIVQMATFFHYLINLNLNFTVGLLPSWNRVCTLQTTHKWREKWEWLWFQLSVWSGREEVLVAYFAQSCIPTFVQLWKKLKENIETSNLFVVQKILQNHSTQVFSFHWKDESNLATAFNPPHTN